MQDLLLAGKATREVDLRPPRSKLTGVFCAVDLAGTGLLALRS